MKQSSGFEWHGSYRGVVTEVDIEDNAYGAVRVYIPDILPADILEKIYPNFETEGGLIAYPKNSSFGGYSPNMASADFQGEVHVPLKGSWCWIEFEGGDPARPYYTGPVMNKSAKLPPECRGVAEPHKVHIMKMQSGRAIVMCDSEDQQRIEICGKKRLMNAGSGPEGDAASVYGMNGNMTTILLDERDGTEKLLISTHKGDYLHIDIDQQMLQFYFQNGVRGMTIGNIDINVVGDININAGGKISMQAGGNSTMKSGGSIITQSDGDISTKSGGNTSIDAGGKVFIQQPSAQDAPTVVPIPPLGFRGT